MFSDKRIMNKDCHMFEAGLSMTCMVKNDMLQCTYKILSLHNLTISMFQKKKLTCMYLQCINKTIQHFFFSYEHFNI